MGVNATPISLSNESPFLMISQSSVADLNEKIRNDGKDEISADCFRGNFLIKGAKEYEEDGWKLISIGKQVFKVDIRMLVCVSIDELTVFKQIFPLTIFTLDYWTM